MDPAVIGAIIGAVATMAAAVIGVWQWRRSRSDQRRTAYDDRRVEALKQLWEKLQSIEAASRLRQVPESGFADQVKGLNIFLHLNAPVLRRDEQEWARACLSSLEQIESILDSVPPDTLAGYEYALTLDALPASSEIFAAFGVYQRQRDLLESRYREALQGK